MKRNLSAMHLVAAAIAISIVGLIATIPLQLAGAVTLSTLTVKTKYTDGTYFSGATVVLKKNGVKVDSKPSPAKFTVTAGEKYTVSPKDTANAKFKEWTSGSTTRDRAVTASTTAKTVTAVYEKGSGTSSCSGTTGGSNTVTVVSCTLDGKSLPGMYVNLRENGNIVADGYTPKTFTMTPGKEYVVVLYWCCDYYFRHYSDDTLTRYHIVTGGSTGILLKGLYEQVPSSQAAKLNVIAKDTNGNTIGGTTTNPDGSISTQPGMWMWLTPPGTSTPYTGAYTGSSSTPFVIFDGKTYKVTMSSFDKYTFDHWADNGSTSPSRSFTMNGDRLNNIAIYRVASGSAAMTTSSQGPAPPPFMDVGS